MSQEFTKKVGNVFKNIGGFFLGLSLLLMIPAQCNNEDNETTKGLDEKYQKNFTVICPEHSKTIYFKGIDKDHIKDKSHVSISGVEITSVSDEFYKSTFIIRDVKGTIYIDQNDKDEVRKLLVHSPERRISQKEFKNKYGFLPQ